MGYYTGFKYKIKVHEEFKEFFTRVNKGDLEITDFPISYVSTKYLAVWLDYLKTDRNTWLVGGGSAYFDEDDWCTEYSLEDDIFYSSGSLKDYDDTIEAFLKILPMFGDEYILMESGEDQWYDCIFDVYKSDDCSLTLNLLEVDYEKL